MNSTTPQLVVPVSHQSQVGEARRAAASLAARCGLAEAVAGSLAIVVTELATNIARHTGGGEILLRRAGSPERGIEVLAIDSGAGMNLERCMEDGYSSGGTKGEGLGAVRRMSVEFEVFSRPGLGTVAFSRVGEPDADGTRIRVGAVSIPYPGEPVCGDAWSVATDGRLTAVAVVDGLGHGALAADASTAALRAFERSAFSPPREVLGRAHDAMRTTRGGAMAVALLSSSRDELLYGGVGNISGTLLHEGATRGLMSHNGTVGAQMRPARDLAYSWKAGSVLILHSDGIGTRWKLDAYPGLATHHPAIIAAVLYRDFRRGRDDATVVAISWARAAA